MGLINFVKRTVNIAARFFVKNEPKIMIGTGVVCLVAAVADGIHAGTKVEKVVTKDTQEIAVARRANNPSDVNKAKLKMLADLAGMFWHVALLTGAGIVLVGRGTIKYEKRWIGLLGAYNLLWDKFGNYRGYVIDEYGADADRRFITAAEKGLVDNTQGRKIVSPDADTKDSGEWKLGKYSRYIGPYECEWWDPTWDINREYFLAHLDAVEAELDRIFHIKQVMLANDANQRLTLPRDQTGATCGWDSSKVDHIKLGHRDPNNPTIAAFLRGDRDDIILNMNCSGFVLGALELRDRAWLKERNRYIMEGK